jgi:hypothetical protein
MGVANMIPRRKIEYLLMDMGIWRIKYFFNDREGEVGNTKGVERRA